jgi:hypothetical protein
MRKLLKLTGIGSLLLLALGFSLWAFGALSYDGPGVWLSGLVMLGLRAIHRQGEDVYLYRTTLRTENARKRLLEYIETLNSLAKKPRWYNAITTNCTTGIRSQNTDRIPWDWRILVNGKGDELMFESGSLESRGLTFSELKKTSHANSAIKAAGDNSDFSARIRTDVYTTKP